MTVKTKEERLAELVTSMEGFFDEKGGLAQLNTRLKAFEDAGLLDLAKLDLKKVIEEVEKLRAGQETLVKQIKSSKTGLYIPGVDAQEFSVTRALLGMRMGGTKDAFEKVGGGHEYEVMKATTEKWLSINKDAMSASNDQSVGKFIPDQVIPEVIAAIYTKSAFVALDGVEGTTRVSLVEGLFGGNVKIPKFDGGLVAYWIGEEDEYAESMMNVGDVTMNPKKLGLLVKLTDTIKRLSGFGFDRLLRQDMVRAAVKKVDYTIPFGIGGDNVPLGIVGTKDVRVYRAETGAVIKNGTDSYGSTWAGAAATFDLLSNMRLALEEDDVDLDSSFAWVFQPRFAEWLKQAKVDQYSSQTTNQGYLVGIPYLPDSRLAEIIGPFSKTSQFKLHKAGANLDASLASGGGANAKFGTIIGGNLGDVVVGRWSGIEIEDDGGKGKGFTSDATYMKLRMYMDVAVRQPRSIILCDDAKISA